MEEPGRLQSMGSLESDTTERLHFHFSLSCIGEGNGNPLQCSCLENPRDREAWWAAVYGVAQSRTRLKRLSSWWPWRMLTLGTFLSEGLIDFCYLWEGLTVDAPRSLRFHLKYMDTQLLLFLWGKCVYYFRFSAVLQAAFSFFPVF